MRLFYGARYRFVESRGKAYAFSAFLIVLGFAAMIYNFATIGSWVPYGVDFTGGSLIQVRFDEDVTAGDLRDALGGAQAPPITQFGEGNEFVIRAPLDEDAALGNVAAQIEAQLREGLPDHSFEVVRTEIVGAKVGSELQSKAVLAILVSFISTLLYLAVRFEFRFGSAALVATIHDILVTLTVLAVFRIEMSLTIVAALLTIVGYSLNDTIVVFDRIREHNQKKGARKRDQVELVNAAINETLPRTVLTGFTTLAALLALLVLGGPVIRDFTLVLSVGCLVGIYSTIFIASPALIEIQQRWGTGKIVGEKKERPQPATV